MNLTALTSAYLSQPKPLDRLPYTPEFEQLARRYWVITGEATGKQEIWSALVNLRKRGELPRRGH